MSDAADARHNPIDSVGAPSAAAPDRAAATEVEVISAEEEISKAGARLTKPAVVYNTRTGEEYDVPRDTIDAIEAFRAPAGFQVERSREGSFLYSLGNYVKPTDLRRNQPFRGEYYCQASTACRRKKKMIPCANGSRSNVNKHMSKDHELRGAQGEKKSANHNKGAATLEDCLHASKTFNVGTQRVRELQAALFVVERFLPFNIFSSGVMFKQMMATAMEGKTYPDLPPKRIKHLLVELYVATKKAVVGKMKEEVEKAPLPILHHMVDAWTCKASGRKFLGFHVHYVNSDFEMKTALLSVKHYAPSQEALAEAKAAEVLLKIFQSTLSEFGLSASDLASGTTDSGSDIKALSVNGLLERYGTLWDWCPCHMLVKAAEHAFGVSADPAKSKNPDACKLLKLVIKVVEKLNKSQSFKAKFDDLQTEMLDDIFKIVKNARQRWLSMSNTLERVIRLWHVLRKLYSNDGETFPLDMNSNKDGILQLFSLLQPLTAITRDAQFGGMPMTAAIHMKFGMLKGGLLDTSKALKVYDIPPIGEDGVLEPGATKGNLPFKMVPPENLHPVASTTRVELCKALLTRFYARVWDVSTPDPSFFRDASVLLTPAYNGGDYLKTLRLTEEDANFLSPRSRVSAPTSDAEVEFKLEEAWDGIKSRAVDAARVLEDRAGAADRPFKRARTSADSGESMRRPEDDDEFAMFGRTGGRGESEEGVDRVLEDVSQELLRYKALFVPTKSMNPCDVLTYWAKSGKFAFPLLKAVAQQTYGNQASAAQIERDFSDCGNLLTPSRSRMDAYWVELVMFLKANFNDIPSFEAIPRIVSADIRKCLPARFNGTDEDLLAAEAVADPVDNDTPPTADSSGLDE